MNLIQSIQSLDSPFFNILMEIFCFLFSHMAFVFLFAIFYLLVNKNDAIKLGFCYSLSFIFGGVFLKNVVNSPKPYIKNPEFFAVRNGTNWGSFPSLREMNIAGIAGAFILKISRAKNKWWICFPIFIGLIACCCGGVLESFLAESFLMDLLMGVVFGALIYVLLFHFVKVIPTNAYSLLMLVVPVAILLMYVTEWGNVVGHEYVFDACGFMAGLILFSYLENRFIRYKVKNNLLFSTFKVLIIVTILSVLYWSFSLFAKPMIVRFTLSLSIMAVVMLLFPFIFKKLEKYFYCFSKEVNQEKIVFSRLTFGEKGTIRVAKRFAKELSAGDFVVLQGDLGAGKTVFTRAILREKNVKNNITSPTFTILNEYSEGENNFYHFDMYRLNDEEEIDNIGFFDAINDKKGIVFVEWAENIASYIPPHYKKITIVKLGKKARNIILENY